MAAFVEVDALIGFDLAVATLLLLLLAAFVAGWVDAVVGGGGLIQLPALLLGLPDATPPADILGTNKVSSVWGTATSAVTYARSVRPDRSTVLALVAACGAGSAGGAQLARYLPKEVFAPVVLVALVGVGLYTWRRPGLGLVSAPRHTGTGHYGRTAALGLGVGAYDGFLGPGTGSFFVIGLVAVLGYGFLEASAKAKIANLVTNLAAIAVFAAHGTVLWRLGLLMGAANLLGGFLGARTAISRGSGFIRRVFLVVVAALALRLSYDVLFSSGS